MSNELRDKLAELKNDIASDMVKFAEKGFKDGWDACEKHYKDEIEYLNRQLADERSGDSDLMKTIRRHESNLKHYSSELEKQSEIIKVLKEALEFYADRSQFENGVISSKDIEPALKITGSVVYHYSDPPTKNQTWVGGKTARQALAKVQEMEGG